MNKMVVLAFGLELRKNLLSSVDFKFTGDILDAGEIKV